jgi:hypothetical protein
MAIVLLGWLRYTAKMLVTIGSYPEIDASSFDALLVSLSSKVIGDDPKRILAENWSSTIDQLERISSPALAGVRNFLKPYIVSLLLFNSVGELRKILGQTPPIPISVIQAAVTEVESTLGGSLRDGVGRDALVHLWDDICPESVAPSPGVA